MRKNILVYSCLIVMTSIVVQAQSSLLPAGGDASGSFNISTASAFVAAAAGARVAKHGNRSVSSKSGSADVLEAAGVNLELAPEQVGECIKHVGVGFLFAVKHHSAMKHAIGPRKEMGVRTIFNLLGPLTNPASAPNQVIGVFSKQWVEPLAQVRDGGVRDLENHVRLKRPDVVGSGHEARHHERERDQDDTAETGDVDPARDVLGRQAPDCEDGKHRESADEHYVDEGGPVVHTLPLWAASPMQKP